MARPSLRLQLVGAEDRFLNGRFIDEPSILGTLFACNVRVATGIGIAILIFNQNFRVKKRCPAAI